MPIVALAASLGGSLFDNRGYWRGAVQTTPNLPAAMAAQTTYDAASIEPNSTGSTALAYAAESEAPAPARTRPMGSRLPNLPREASVMPAQGNTTVVEKSPLAAALASTGQRVYSPWLRAAVLTPSFSTYMTATRLGAVDMRPLNELLYKPSMSVAMTFSADPQLGMVASRYTILSPDGTREFFPPLSAARWDTVLRPRGPEIFDTAMLVWTSSVLVRRSVLGDHRFDDLAEERKIGPRRILGGKFNVRAERLGIGYCLTCIPEDLLSGFL